MDLSRLKKGLSGLAITSMLLTQVTAVFAAYSDVPDGAWYKAPVADLLERGILDRSQPRFRPGDLATRAEFIKVIVELNGGTIDDAPAQPSFDDVPPSHWGYAYMEAAAKEGYVKGDKDCYGSHPCYARPNATVNRAEAATIIGRAFNLEWTGDAPQFVDNPSGQWYTDAVQTAADHCVLQGDGNTGRVRPADPMNRAEMVAMLTRAEQGLQYGVDCGETPVNITPAVTDAVALSSTTIEVSFNVVLDSSVATVASNYTVTGAAEMAIDSVKMVNDKTVEITLVDPTEADREYTVAVSDMMTEDGDTFSDTTTFRGYTPIVKGKGTLEVSISSKNPVSDTIPKGAVGVVVLSLDLTASCDDSVKIDGITLLHEGFGSEIDISGVYAAVNGARISRRRTVDSQEQTAQIHFTKSLVIDACKTTTVDFASDFNTTATTAAEHSFAVELASDFTSNALNVSGNFPLRGNTFRIAAVATGIVSVAYRTISPNKVNVGDKDVVVGKFELSTNSVEDETVYSMTFQQNSTVNDGEVTNLKVRRSDGTVLTNVVATTIGDYVTLVFDPPFTILEGDKITMELVATIVGGAGDSIIFHFEEQNDIFAVGSLYGYGVNNQLYGSQITLPTETTSLPASVTVDAGQFTVEIDGPPQTGFNRRAKDAVVANVILTTTDEPVNIRQMYFAIQAQTSTGAALETVTTGSYDNIPEVLENVTLRNTVTGRTVSAVTMTTNSTDRGVCVHACTSPASASSSGTYQIYRIDDLVVQGKQKWELRVNFIDNGTGNHPRSGDRFRVIICGEPTKITSGGALTTNTIGCSFGGLITSSTTYQMNVEGISTGDKVGDVRPRGNIAGNFQRISTSSLTVAVKNLTSTDSAVKNAQNVNLMRFETRAGEAQDILITKVVVDAKSGSLNNANDYQLWVDTDGDSKVDTILQKGVAAQSSSVTFNQLTGGGFVDPKNKTVIFEVHGKVAASLTNGWLQMKFATGSTSYIEAEELQDGSALSGIKTNNVLPSGVTSADITVTTVDSTLYTLVSQGDLFVTKDTVSLRNHQYLGGALGDEMLRLKLHAEYEDVEVTDLQFTASGAATTSGNSIDRLELYKEGDSVPFALATVGGCGSDDALKINPGVGSIAATAFCAQLDNHELTVQKGADSKVLVRPRLKLDTQGATSNDTIQVFMDQKPVSNFASGSGAVRARGLQSSNNLAANDEDSTAGEGEVFIGTSTAAANTYIVGQKNVSVLAKISSITNANPDANGTNVPTGISDVGQFKVSAAAHQNSQNGLNLVVLSGVIFNVTSTNVNMDPTTFLFYNKTISNVTKTCTVLTTGGTAIAGTASGAFIVNCPALQASSVNVSTDQGKDSIFVLQANVTNAKAAPSATSTLQVSLQNFDSLTRATYSATTSHFDWVDKDSSATRFFWVEYSDTTIKSTSYQS